MRAVGVGFRVADWTYSEERDGLTSCARELTELSAVPIGCNQEALAKAASAELLWIRSGMGTGAAQSEQPARARPDRHRAPRPCCAQPHRTS